MRSARCLLGAVIGVLASAAPAQTAPTEGVEARLVGLWGVTRSFGPEIRGELTIARTGAGWRASIAGTGAPVVMAGGNVTFELPGKLGGFRGHRGAPGAGIRGAWIQPAGIVTGVAWATPMELRPIGTEAWRGTVTPFEETVTLYLDVRADPQGRL